MKLALGTVQLGLFYGIANATGKPKREEALKIIQYAAGHGIDLLDTAAAYGDSEEIIGQYFSGEQSNNNIRVATKIPKIAEQLSNDVDLEKLINKYVQESLVKLNKQFIDYCLLHDSKNMDTHNGVIPDILKKLKTSGVIRKIGVSVYHPDEVRKFLRTDCFNIIQVPLNIFDQRLLSSGLLAELKKKKIEIHARSAYLQGLLLMDPGNLPAYLDQAKKPIESFQHLADKLELSRRQLALLYVRDIQEADKVIVGCETIDQLKENIAIFNMPPLKKDIIELINDAFCEMPDTIINPSRWGKANGK